MTRKEYKKLKKMDLDRYGKKHLGVYLVSTDYRIVYHYRKCKYLSEKKALKLLYFLERLYYNHICVKYGCDIPSHANIGGGLRIDHANGILINSKAKIGQNLTIKSGAVIGSNKNGVPSIGDGVLVGAHSIIIGDIIIGDNAEIGAGAIVVKDVPQNAVVVNQPATIIKYKGKTNNEL